MIYGNINLEEIKKQAAQVESQSGGRFNSTDIVNKPWVVGSNYFWLLPPLKGQSTFAKYKGTYFDIFQPDGKKLIRDCARNTTDHGKCPICDVLMCASAFTNITKMQEKPAYYVNVIKLIEDEE